MTSSNVELGGAVFIPHASLPRVLSIVQDNDHHRDFCGQAWNRPEDPSSLFADRKRKRIVYSIRNIGEYTRYLPELTLRPNKDALLLKGQERGFMLAGKLFSLNRDTLAVVVVDGRPRPIIVPAGIVIEVVSDPKLENNTVDVLWSGRTVEMFALDIRHGGSVVANRSAGA